MNNSSEAVKREEERNFANDIHSIRFNALLVSAWGIYPQAI
jgi:hypothetical protein